MIIQPLSESAVMVQFGQSIDLETHKEIMALVHTLTQNPFPGLRAVSPAFTSVLLVFDPFLVDKMQGQSASESVCNLLRNQFDQVKTKRLAPLSAPNIHHIPVRYGGSFGPDIEEVAKRTGLDIQSVINLHSSKVYHVFMIGFLPGFPYMGILPKELQLPRLASPRLKVPAGSVAIAGPQTGIYPQSSPGGWHLIGHTDLDLFVPHHDPPCLLQPGDRVRFVPY